MVTSLVVLAPEGAFWPDYTIDFTGNPITQVVGLGLTGLEPVDATINTTSYSEADGEFYTDSKVGKRNIVATLGMLSPSARDEIYAYFLPKNPIKLRLNFDDRDFVEIDGYVEKVTPGSRFSESPSGLQTMQVSIINPKPNFLSALKTVQGHAYQGVVPDPNYTEELVYQGTAQGGMFFEMFANANYTGTVIIMARVGTGGFRRMEFRNLTIPSGWHLFISTHRGLKIAEVRPPASLLETDPDTKPRSALGKMVDTYFWTQFYAAEHQVEVMTPMDNSAHFPWTISYSNQFAGV